MSSGGGPDDPPAPSFKALDEDFKQLRIAGRLKLRQLSLPALAQAARALNYVNDDEDVDAAVLDRLLRIAASELGGERLERAAAKLYGLEPGYIDQTPAQNREAAAEVYRVSVSRFRQRYEPDVRHQLAEAVLRRIAEHHLRLTHARMARRTPVSTRLAVQWLERFEAYYRVWTPISALGGDLTAYRSCLLEEDRPYDREPDPDEPDDEGYSQELQARGYGTSAWFRFAEFLWELKRFVRRYGGLWVLSDAQAEQDLADSVYRITHASPFNTRDDSALRGIHQHTLSRAEERLLHLAQETGGEQHPFLITATGDSLAMALHKEWQEWLERCECSWQLGERAGREPFPSHRQFSGISAGCPIHKLITACGDYMMILDDDWDRIADWYHIQGRPRSGITGEELYSPEDI